MNDVADTQSVAESEAVAPHRVIVLGASNVTIGLPTIVRVIRSGFSGPLHLDIADGHGRSYGKPTNVLMRGLPGHTMRPLPELQPASRTSALLTDIGNDLVYDISVPQIGEWVREYAERLVSVNADIIMTELPLASIRSLSKTRFALFRTLFFPGSRLKFSEVRDRAERLNELVREIAASVDARLVEPVADWYGLDPIHIRRTARYAAWNHVLDSWTDWQRDRNVVPMSLTRRLQLWRSKPQERHWFGKLKTHADMVDFDPETVIRFF